MLYRQCLKDGLLKFIQNCLIRFHFFLQNVAGHTFQAAFARFEIVVHLSCWDSPFLTLAFTSSKSLSEVLSVFTVGQAIHPAEHGVENIFVASCGNLNGFPKKPDCSFDSFWL